MNCIPSILALTLSLSSFSCSENTTETTSTKELTTNTSTEISAPKDEMSTVTLNDKENEVNELEPVEKDGKEIIKGTCSIAGIHKVKLEQNEGKFSKTIGEATLDSSGDFILEAKLEPLKFYRLNFEDKAYVFIYDDFDELTTTVSSSKVTVTGSNESRIYTDAAYVSNKYNVQLEQLQQEASSKGMTNEIRMRYQMIMQKSEQELKTFILKESPSVSALVISADFLSSATDNVDFIAEIIKKYDDTDYFPELKAQMVSFSQLATGNTAPEIELKNAQGETIKLSNLRGKYVLIDFWASWCRPCMAELPNVKTNYAKYKNDGFEIVGISSDKTKEAWTNAILKKEMTWTHMWDAKGKASQQYMVRGIPYTVLIDKEGKIVSRNLRGEQLGAKLAEIFKH